MEVTEKPKIEIQKVYAVLGWGVTQDPSAAKDVAFDTMVSFFEVGWGLTREDCVDSLAAYGAAGMMAALGMMKLGVTKQTLAEAVMDGKSVVYMLMLITYRAVVSHLPEDHPFQVFHRTGDVSGLKISDIQKTKYAEWIEKSRTPGTKENELVVELESK